MPITLALIAVQMLKEVCLEAGLECSQGRRMVKGQRQRVPVVTNLLRPQPKNKIGFGVNRQVPVFCSKDDKINFKT